MIPGVLKETLAKVKEGQSVRELCVFADQRLEEETGKAYKKDKKILKGMKVFNQLSGSLVQVMIHFLD